MKYNWKNKNVFITGINGFIGGNLAKKLLGLGANVFGLQRNDKTNTFLYFEGLAKEVILFKGSLLDRELLERIVSEEQIDVVFHLAAQVEVGVAAENPFMTFETNIRGTYTLLEAIRTYGKTVESIIMASSDKAYGNYEKEQMPYKENYSLIPQFPYDVSKACADLVAKSYASDVFKMPIIVTRFCNIYGPGQLNFSAVIPDSIQSALGYSTFIPRGDGSQVRDFLYVEDVANVYVTLAEKLAETPSLRGEVFNAGTNSPTSIKDVIKKVFELLGNTEDFATIENLMQEKSTVGEIDCQYMDYQKLKEYFDWSPTYGFDEGMTKTIEWFKGYLKETRT